jgi:CheY-like chemotaxis protein
MKVDQCDLGQLADYLKSAANGGPAFQLIIADGSLDDLSEVVSEFHSNAGNRPPKLVLLTSDPVEKSKHLAADAVLYTPLRVKAFWDKLRELLPNVRVQPPPSAPFSSRISGKAPPLGTGKVLVADDNLINQKLACALLSRLGCQVDTADNGAEAVKKVGLGGYELVFMDCVMPEMDGFAATSAIRSLAGRCGAVPIVALTASATTEDRDHCLAVGMNDFLTKPIRSEQLAASITKWIPRHAG